MVHEERDKTKSNHAQEVLNIYSGGYTLVDYYEVLSHDGTDSEGYPESNIWDLFVLYSHGKEYYVDHWSWEEWFRDRRPRPVGYLEHDDATLSTLEEFCNTYWGSQIPFSQWLPQDAKN
jgi:hypothetical protein